MNPQIYYKEVSEMNELALALNEFFDNGKSPRQVIHLIHGFAPLTGKPFISIIYFEPPVRSNLIGVTPGGI